MTGDVIRRECGQTLARVRVSWKNKIKEKEKEG